MCDQPASCSCRLALQDLNRALRGPRAGAQQPQQRQPQQQRAVPSACRLQPGYQHPASLDRAASASMVGPAWSPPSSPQLSLQTLPLVALSSPWLLLAGVLCCWAYKWQAAERPTQVSTGKC